MSSSWATAPIGRELRRRVSRLHEKIAPGRAIYPADALERGAGLASRRLISFDALAVAREHGTEPNAVQLGLLAGMGVLPLPSRPLAQRLRGGVARTVE